MPVRLLPASVLTGICLCIAQTCHAIEITPTQGGGPTPQELAENIADQAGGVAVVAASATTEINSPPHSNPLSDPRAMGRFINGITAAGTTFENGGSSGTYAGGIGIDTGVCLCTGIVSDSLASAGFGLGFGMEGPNNGDGEGIFLNDQGVPENHTGEITSSLISESAQVPLDFIDEDFDDFVFPGDDPGGGDPTVLQFEIQISSPGFLRISFVFGSDEHPFYTNPLEFEFNDSVAIIINDENVATTTIGGVQTPFDLFEISECGPLIFTENNTAPAPAELTTSFNPPNLHAIPSASRYNIEFGGFTKKLTREVSCPLAPGTYTVKIVVQDVGDRRVDAGVFLEENSLKLFPLQQGDYNGDGCVDQDDYTVWVSHYGTSPACFYDGDGNGNGIVDTADYNQWRRNLGNSGNTDFRADFNRDGEVNASDSGIFGGFYNVLTQCASRFEGDADGDGDVDDDDFSILAANLA